MADAVDTYIEPLNMDMEEFYLLSSTEREQVYESAIEDLSDEEIEELRLELLEKMSYLVEEFAVQAAELEDIIDSDDSTVEEITRANMDIEDIEEMQTVAEQFSTEFGDAQTDLQSHNVETTSAYTVDAGSDVQNGEEFVVDCTETATISATPDWAEDEHPDWLDTNEDGIGDTDPDEDGDGIADEDFNDDGVISEADAQRDATAETTQVITLTVEATDTVRVASYDASTGTVRFSITKEDGTVYYVTIKSVAGAIPNIKFTSSTALHSDDFVDQDSELVNRIYTNVSTEYSLGHYLGMDDSDKTDESYYTIIDLNDIQPDFGEYDLTVSGDDVANERDIEITCQTDSPDTLSFTFPDDVAVDFELTGETTLVITLTDTSGNVSTITVKNFDWDAETSTNSDLIRISGGDVDEDDKDGLMYYRGSSWSYGSTYLTDYIYYGDESIHDLYGGGTYHSTDEITE